LVASSPGLIAGSNVLHRLLMPRHPPCALTNLTTVKDARVLYTVLKQPPGPHRDIPTRTCVNAGRSRDTMPWTTKRPDTTTPHQPLPRRKGPDEGVCGPRTLRTQQRATGHPTQNTRPRSTPSRAVLAAGHPLEVGRTNSQCSTLEHSDLTTNG
jgi:hypothetical protein